MKSLLLSCSVFCVATFVANTAKAEESERDLSVRLDTLREESHDAIASPHPDIAWIKRLDGKIKQLEETLKGQHTQSTSYADQQEEQPWPVSPRVLYGIDPAVYTPPPYPPLTSTPAKPPSGGFRKIAAKQTDTTPPQDLTQPPNPPKGDGDSTPKSGCSDDATLCFGGLHLGPAAAYTIGGKKNVNTAQLEGNVVRVTDGTKGDLGVWAESHVFFTGFGPKRDNDIKHEFGVGLFGALQVANSGGTVNAGAAGLMLGAYAGQDQALNLSAGWSITKVKTLGDGLSEGSPLPTGVTSVYTKTALSSAPMVMLSYSWNLSSPSPSPSGK